MAKAKSPKNSNDKMMDDIVDNMGKDYDYNVRIESRNLQKQGEDPEDIGGLAEEEATKKVKKKYTGKMGGGMMKQPMGYTSGGMCRGMGAAIRGGKFEGVK